MNRNTKPDAEPRRFDPAKPLLERMEKLEEEMLAHVQQVISPASMKQNFRDRAAIVTEARLIVQIWAHAEKLREEEGAQVTFVCDNPEFNDMPNCCVFVTASWTNDKEQDFRGETVLDCLQKAIEAKQNWESAHA